MYTHFVPYKTSKGWDSLWLSLFKELHTKKQGKETQKQLSGIYANL